MIDADDVLRRLLSAPKINRALLVRIPAERERRFRAIVNTDSDRC
jgi:hypothetical protein